MLTFICKLDMLTSPIFLFTEPLQSDNSVFSFFVNDIWIYMYGGVILVLTDSEFPTGRFDIFIWLYNNNTNLQISDECILT
jgi:hypothetical protein